MYMKWLVTITLTITLLLAFYLAAVFMTGTIVTLNTALAQVPPAPILPDGGDLTTDNQLPGFEDEPGQEPIQSTSPANTNVTPPPTIQIASHQDGSQVPVGELTIQGTSSDNQESNCQVYADVNDISPLQNATAAGANGSDDYSQWTFTYAEDYQLITPGVNELTARISCFENGGSATIPLSEWHSVNVTGVASNGTSTSTTTPNTTTPTMTQTPTTDGTLGTGQGANLPFSASEESSEDSSQGLGEGAEQGGGGGNDGGDDDDNGGDDDGGDDDGGDDDDDDGDG
jgi:hypothetical protein